MFNSKKKAAIKALQRQKEKLKYNDTYLTNVWVLQTSEILKKYLGSNSDFYKSAQQMKLQIAASNTAEFNENKRYYQDRAKRFIDGCIQYIHENGIVKERKPNFLTSISDELVWGIYIGTVYVAFYVGVWWATAPINPNNYPQQNNTVIEKPLPTVIPSDSANLNSDKPPNKKSK